jgi:hypothetical protein
VDHSSIRDTGHTEFVTLTDPDDIVWELWALKA